MPLEGAPNQGPEPPFHQLGRYLSSWGPVNGTNFADLFPDKDMAIIITCPAANHEGETIVINGKGCKLQSSASRASQEANQAIQIPVGPNITAIELGSTVRYGSTLIAVYYGPKSNLSQFLIIKQWFQEPWRLSVQNVKR